MCEMELLSRMCEILEAWVPVLIYLYVPQQLKIRWSQKWEISEEKINK